MAKSGYKKFKKQEKAKVKLKGNKTLLPKGQNVTDTSFKVKKIVVKEQLKEHQKHELLTRRHLNIKELISRLSHHNTKMRQDALAGLRELVTAHGSHLIQANLSPLLQAVLALVVDRESDVRTDCLKLLSIIFDKMNEEELSPMFPAMVSFVTCAMTHIDPSVRADSLRLMDTMLAGLPGLTAAHTHTLLPFFLDLISERDSKGGGRSLSLHLDGRVTSDKWRARVVGRLNRLFSVLLDHINKDGAEVQKEWCSVRWRADQPTHLGLYSRLPSHTDTAQQHINTIPIKEYAEVLVPLLLDSFIEAVPKQDHEDSHTACVVGVEVAALIQGIVQVILHIWTLLHHCSREEPLTQWLKHSWGELLMSRVLKGRFPYSLTGANSRKRQQDQMLAALQMSWNREQSCSLLNLQLCLLAFRLTPPGDIWVQCISYIKRNLRGGRPVSAEEGAVLCQCLEAASQSSDSNTPSLLSVVANCDILNSVDSSTSKKAFDLLSRIALKPYHPLHGDEHFNTWLDSLPALLCRPTVPLSVLRRMATIAARGWPAFNNSLDGWVEQILDNLASVKVVGSEGDEGHHLIVSLVYWVQDWDKDLVKSIRQLVEQGGLRPHLLTCLLDVLRLKAENIENVEVKMMLEGAIEEISGIENIKFV